MTDQTINVPYIRGNGINGRGAINAKLFPKINGKICCHLCKKPIRDREFKELNGEYFLASKFTLENTVANTLFAFHKMCKKKYFEGK